MLRNQLEEFNDELPKVSNLVIQSLIDIKGRSQAEVLVFIVVSWIGEHMSELKSYGIEIEKTNGKIKI